jgi:uncharacterized glyoxalase superfamily protein PhnB/predicted kinase
MVPLLVVRGAAHAIDFYVRALQARVLNRLVQGDEQRISHADLAVGTTLFSLTEEARGWNSDAPPSLGGSPVVMQLVVSNAAAALQALQDAGATLIFPLREWRGERMARVRDPFGHLWLLRERRLGEPQPAEAQPGEPPLPERPLENEQSLGEERQALQASSPRLPRACLHLVLGPVGAGKSTLALQLASEHGALRLTLDEWMARLFRPDRPETDLMEWYVERASRCVEQIWALALALLATGTSAVLEIGLLQRSARESFYRRVETSGSALCVYVLDAPRELRRARVLARNHRGGPTFSGVVPAEIFELASDLWEPLEAEECQGREVRFLVADQ